MYGSISFAEWCVDGHVEEIFGGAGGAGEWGEVVSRTEDAGDAGGDCEGDALVLRGGGERE